MDRGTRRVSARAPDEELFARLGHQFADPTLLDHRAHARLRRLRARRHAGQRAPRVPGRRRARPGGGAAPLRGAPRLARRRAHARALRPGQHALPRAPGPRARARRVPRARSHGAQIGRGGEGARAREPVRGGDRRPLSRRRARAGVRPGRALLRRVAPRRGDAPARPEDALPGVGARGAARDAALRGARGHRRRGGRGPLHRGRDGERRDLGARQRALQALRRTGGRRGGAGPPGADAVAEHRAGVVALLGRPNVGQVDAAEPAPRPEARDRHREAADHAQPDPRHLDPARRADPLARYARPARGPEAA